MTTTAPTTAPKRVPTRRAPMDSLRKTALVAGVLYLITFVSIPTLWLWQASVPRWRCTRCSSGRTREPRSAWWARGSWKPPPSSLASSAF
ncbi:MAG: hypothetical protein JWN06_1671 [Propionibacteriaceae bacterium]|jgi:hypothetical protein|nr:hypothetical protein [Propionibacteriaceae bacterium]